jgi:RES domain-containing protein
MIVFRLCKREYRKDLSGGGAWRFGGRWNSKGTFMVYTGETRALCSTEIAVHSPYGIIPEDHFMVSIEIPNTIKIKELPIDELPYEWNHFPQQEETQKTGDAFVEEGKYLILKVPSATIQGEHNYLMNPNHPDMKRVSVIQVEPFTFDKRLFIR